ncbi:f-box domain-containing protein [Gigaspora margarita]|uniref:F-box domain-containing protein n=1 Tax=Gigaspora margarita TaxID=4874 RepID=A0A8H3XIK6_GIGMA|nr:f-box domain-containing protein [Gigaspora margarita]
MIALPNECLFEIFINLSGNYKSLFSCLLVSRRWCRNVVPILWNELDISKNKNLLKTCLLLLNDEEQVKLIPFDLILSKNQNPLFLYTSYTTVIKINSDDGIINWINQEGHGSRYSTYYSCLNIVQSIKYSLTLMFLRTCKKLKDLSIYGKSINLLDLILVKNFSLTSLKCPNNELDSEEINVEIY